MPRRRALSVCGLLIALTMSRPLGAQGAAGPAGAGTPARARTVVEIGATAVQFPEDGTSAAGPSASLASEWDARTLFASGMLAGVASASGGAGAAVLLAGARADLADRWLAELGTELSAVVGGTSRASRSGTLAPRLVRTLDAGGLWLRASGSIAGRELGALWGRSVDAGGWWRRGPAQLRGSFTREWSAGQLFIGPAREHPFAVVPVRFDEGAAAAQLETGAVDLSLGAAVRRDPDAAQRYEPAWSADAALWVSETMAVTVSAARTLPDFIRGADAARYVSLGLRWGRRGSRAAREPSAERPVLSLEAADDSLLLRVRAPGAHSVQLMADFTDWEPVTLALDRATFVRRVKLAPGVHRVLVRVDGGEWKPAANTPAVDDDLGGRVGLIVVP